MSDVFDLRQIRPEQLEPVLQAEAVEWQRDLLWDYTSSIDLIRQYMQARILPGYVLAEGTGAQRRPQGYGFFVYEAQKGLIGALYVHPSHRTPGRVQEQRLLRHMIETLQATPGLARIEAQLMPFRPEELAGVFRGQHFQAFRRLFMHIPADRFPAFTPPPGATLAIEPWNTRCFEEAAALIQRAYQNHVDSEVNDQYRSFAGSLRFLNNIVQYPGCGHFDPGSSLLLRNSLTGSLEGLLLTSLVRPDIAHITQICLQPALQGHGWGRHLLSRAMELLRDRKHPPTGKPQPIAAVTLTVTEANHAAVALYRKLGFNTLREFDAYVWQP